MNIIKTILMGSIITSCLITGSFGQNAIDSKIKTIADSLCWYNNSAFKITDGKKNIYIDINTTAPEQKADLILFTHAHDDHFSAMAINGIIGENTVIIAPPPCHNKFLKEYNKKLIALAPGDSTEIEGIKIKAVYAYNIQKKWHARSENFVGYLITIDGVTIYHTGDTERIPEMQSIKCDIVLLPLGQKYTMNSVEEASEVVSDVKAKIAIPMHWGAHEGTAADVTAFQKLLKNKKIDCVVKQVM